MGYAETCKAKGIKLQLGWFAPRELWKKYWDGKTVYFKGENTAAGYEQALRAYLQARHKPTFEDEGAKRDLCRKAIDWYAANGEPAGETGHLAALQNLLATVDVTDSSRGPFSLLVEGLDYNPGPAVWAERFRSPTKSAPSISVMVQKFLDTFKGRVATGERSPRTLLDLEKRLKFFTANINPSQSVETINGQMVEQYLTILRNQAWDNVNRENHRTAFGQFVRWLYRTEVIDSLPRNLGDSFNKSIGRDGKVKKVKGERLWTAADVKQAAKLGDWWEMAVLLALNCGFTPVDFENLQGEQIDFTKGRLVHQRHKTERIRNPPIVNYKLWPRTLELLKKLAARSGSALKMPGHEHIQTHYMDNLGRNWARLKRDSKAPDKRLDYCRKTGATFFAAKNLDRAYLCDKTGGVAANYYIYHDGKPHADFDAEMVRFGQQLGILPKKTRTKTGAA